MFKKYQAYAYFLVATVISVVLNPLKAFAITKNDLNSIDLPVITTNKKGTEILTSAAAAVINIILLIAGILAVIYLVFSGVTYVTAGGDTGKAEKGRTGIVNAIIGLVIIAAAYILVKFVGGVLNEAPSARNSNTVI